MFQNIRLSVKNPDLSFRKKVIPVFLIFLGAIFSLGAKNLTYLTEGDFEIQYPEKWTITDVTTAPGGKAQDYALIGTRDTGSGFENRFDLFIEPSEIPLTDETVSNMKLYYLEELPRSSGIEVDNIQVSLDDIGPHRLIRSRYESSLSGLEDKIITEQFYVPGEGRTFILTFVALESDHDALSGEFLQMTSSLQDLSAKGSGWASLPDWLQLALLMFGILIIFLIARSIYASWKKSREETIIYRHDPYDRPTHGTAQTRYPNSDRGTGYTRDKGNVPEPRPSPQPTSQPRPESRPEPELRKPTRASSKSIWPLIIFLIIIFNVIRQCIQSN